MKKNNVFSYEKDKVFPEDIVYIKLNGKSLANYYPKQDMIVSSTLSTSECLCSPEELMEYLSKELKPSLQFNQQMSNMQ